MLVDLTVCQETKQRYYDNIMNETNEDIIKEDEKQQFFDNYFNYDNIKLKGETGIYRWGCSKPDGFVEKIEASYDLKHEEYLHKYVLTDNDFHGIADNIEQIKEKHKLFVEGDEKFILCVNPIWQKDEPKWGGFRFHKNGQYIGKYEVSCEYFAHEDWGEDFQGYVLIYEFFRVKENGRS